MHLWARVPSVGKGTDIGDRLNKSKSLYRGIPLHLKPGMDPTGQLEQPIIPVVALPPHRRFRAIAFKGLRCHE